MSLSPQKKREIVLQILYSIALAKKEDATKLVSLLSSELKVTKKSTYEALEYANKIIQEQETLDKWIRTVSISYDFERIPHVERNILRIGCYELLHHEISHKIAITEGVRLAKKFSSTASASFVHAILDAMHKQQQGETVDKEELIRSCDQLVESEEKAKMALENQDSLEKKRPLNET